MPAHMRVLPKPKKGAATAARRSRKRAADRVLSRNAATVRERDGHRCRICRGTHLTQVHHIRFRSQGGSHTTSNLIVVDQVCHDAIHARKLTVWGDGNRVIYAQWAHETSVVVSSAPLQTIVVAHGA